MTLDEAINQLKDFIILHREQHGWDVRTLKALDMAIKALETLEEFEKAQIITGGRLNGRTYAYKCGLEDGKRKALEQTRWMPCSKRLPEEYTIVIGITKFGDIYKTELYDDCGEKKWCADGSYDVPIVAWIPLPQLYTESEVKE